MRRASTSARLGVRPAGALLLLSLVTIACPAGAQVAPDLAAARSSLVGPSGRTWVKERVVVSMGGDRRCTAGESYRFRANQTVAISTCTNHVLNTRTASWTLAPDPPQDVKLAFDGRAYQLSFSGGPHSAKMRWRMPGQLKPNLTTDIELGLSKD